MLGVAAGFLVLELDVVIFIKETDTGYGFGL